MRRPSGTLLLESADIDSKDDLKACCWWTALRITALGDTVTIQALSANSAALLELLDGAPSGSPISAIAQPNGQILTFPAVSSLLDEDARLCSLSVFDAFRLLQELVTVPANEREAMFFGGLFAYDLVAGFEDLPPCRRHRLPGLLLLSGGDPAGHRPSDQAYPHPGEPVHAAGSENSAWSSA